MELDRATMEFGYRTSTIRNNSFIVTEVTFELQKGDKDVIKARMEDLMVRRRDKQPLEYPSAGSTFKRPEGHFAGKLIADAGVGIHEQYLKLIAPALQLLQYKSSVLKGLVGTHIQPQSHLAGEAGGYDTVSDAQLCEGGQVPSGNCHRLYRRKAQERDSCNF